MHVIVLVKQVPDVSNIPEDAWDREKGTLRRGLLDSVLNPLDLHALSFAKMLTAGDPDAKTIYLTMGPPQARDVLVDCLSRAPGEAVLLTDRAMGGADTPATAYSLAQGIRRIERELLGGSRDYLIVTGMQSVDGDTAQVPPQIAEDLGIDQIAYVQGVELTPKLKFRRIGATGIEDVIPAVFPTLVTITACMDTLYSGFHASRAARTSNIHTWSAADVEAAPDRIGIKGSRTTVYRIFSPSEDRAKTCEMVTDPAQLVAKIKAKYRLATGGPAVHEEGAYALEGRDAMYHGPFWVLAESEGDDVKTVSLEILGKTRELAQFLGEKVGVVLPAASVSDELAASLIAHGADTVYAIEDPRLAEFNALRWKAAISALVLEHKPQVMLFGATPLGRELAPRIAYASDSGLTADCTKLEIGDFKANVAILKQTRPALGGNIMATIMTKDSPTQMATVRPGVFKIPPPDPTRKGEVVRIKPNLPDVPVSTVIPIESFTSKVSIRDAKILVSGGHGIRNRADFDRLLNPLAGGLTALLGDDAKVSASRHAVEDGFTTHDYQVGQTGQTVAPRLYMAIGISGAVQHISGMQMSDTVVAINKDPRARIFNYADFGIVGDLETVVPALTRAAKEAAR